MRVGDTGERLIIMWISKGWTTHELQLPVFYREALARLLALEKFRNLIETNIEAGITLYTDHKPALFENSLSNKGQLSAWKLAEVSNLLSIVENLYRQGGEMLFADPLSRVCGPTEGWHDPGIPCKIATLLKHLPESIRETSKIRLYAGKDTSGVSKILYQWRKTKNLLASSITQGKLSTSGDTSDAFHIGIEDVNKVVDLCRMLIKEGKQFAILIPISIVGEIARLENIDNGRHYDTELTSSVEKLSRIILAQDAEMWLISLDKHHIDEFISLQKQMEANLQELAMIKKAVTKAKESKTNKALRQETEFYYYVNYQDSNPFAILATTLLNSADGTISSANPDVLTYKTSPFGKVGILKPDLTHSTYPGVSKLPATYRIPYRSICIADTSLKIEPPDAILANIPFEWTNPICFPFKVKR
jgi:hypothetical protein